MDKPRATWKRAEKLKSRKHIERVFREGRSISVFPYKVMFVVEGPGTGRRADEGTAHSHGKTVTRPAGVAGGSPLQAGFGVSSRNFKKAVHRNRIKRLGREAYRLQKAELMAQLARKSLSMAVFFIFTGKELPDFATVSARIGVALQKLVKETA